MEKESGGYDPKKDIGATIRFLNGILEKRDTFARHIDSQVQILIGLSSATFLFSGSNLLGKEPGVEIAWLVLGTFAALAALVGLLAIHPPRFMRKRGQNESLMYNKKISSFASSSKYEEELRRVVGDQDALIKQYSIEIYNLSKYYYQPKRKLFRISRNLYFAGIGLSLTLLIFAFFAS